MKKLLLSLIGVAVMGAGFNTNQPLTVVATAKIKAGQEDVFKTAANELVRESRKQSGVIDYAYNQSLENSTEFVFVEHYKSMADFDAHMSSPALQNFFNTVKNLFEEGYPQIKKYQEVEE